MGADRFAGGVPFGLDAHDRDSTVFQPILPVVADCESASGHLCGRLARCRPAARQILPFGTGFGCPATDCSVIQILFGCVWWIDGDRFVVSEVDEAGPQASETVVCALGDASAEHVQGSDGSVMALPGFVVVE